MNSSPNAPYTNNNNQSQKKKCSCEDKYGPKPFSTKNSPSNKTSN